jgi:hypothetical protein
MLRFLIVTGLLLMGIGFGAAGWQYWQGMAPVDATSADATPAKVVRVQSWLISPTGGLVPQAEVRAYLQQDRYVESRTVKVTRSAKLSDLLAEGEKLPDPAYLQVLADIRAPKVAEALCAVLTASIASDCAVHSARSVEDSVDRAAGTAKFSIEIAFRQKLETPDLPDLAAHVLQGTSVRMELEPGAPGTESPEAALAAAVDLAKANCDGRGVGQSCRITDLSAEWAPGSPVNLGAKVAWLDPLPEGLFPAPPLDTATDG